MNPADVAQVSKPAVSRVSKPRALQSLTALVFFHGWAIWRSAWQHWVAAHRLLINTLLIALAPAWYGCDKPPTQAASAPAQPTNAAPGFSLTNAQPKLTTMKLWLGSQELTAELAMTLPQIMTGMMFRKEMAENEGMLFIFGRAHRASFYMRNTFVPLSCAYIDTEGAILEIHDMKPLDESPIEANSDNIQYVLEVKQGWFDRNKVATGAVVRTEFGSLPDTFFKRR